MFCDFYEIKDNNIIRFLLLRIEYFFFSFFFFVGIVMIKWFK